MKILVLFTGGTIGSASKEGWISTDSNMNYVLIDNYREKTKDCDTEFVTLMPYAVLSENLTAVELNLLLKVVSDSLDADFDGIVVTHGTDSLLYTASALSFAVSGCKVPVLLVSSNYTLSDERANGNDNFHAAVEFIRSGAGEGVFVSYRNEHKSVVNFHTASRLIQYPEASADLYSIDGEPYAYFDGTVRLNAEYKPSLSAEGIGAVSFCDAPDIAVIESRPCDSFDYPLDNVRAVVLKPYHSGTLNTQNKRLKDFCCEARKRNIPVFLINVRPGASYESAKLFDELGLVVLPLCAFVPVYVKIWAAISMGADIREFVETPIASEFCVL